MKINKLKTVRLWNLPPRTVELLVPSVILFETIELLLSLVSLLSLTLVWLVFAVWSCATNCLYLAMMAVSVDEVLVTCVFSLLISLAATSLLLLLSKVVERLDRLSCFVESLELLITFFVDGSWFSANNCDFRLCSFFKLLCKVFRRFSAILCLKVAE